MTDPKPPLRQVSVTLTPRAAHELAELHADTEQSRGQLVNRAVGLLYYVTEQDDAGQDLMLRNRETGDLTLVRLL